MSANVNLSSSSHGRRSIWTVVTVLLVCGALGLTAFAQFKRAAKAEAWGFKVVARFPHDPNAFTQGLVYVDGELFEGTGKKGESSLRRVNLETGKVEKFIPLHSHYFGEGITVLKNQIYQLTWENRVGIVYDRESFEVKKTFPYTGEGWGLTNDGQRLLMSDGSAVIRFLNPDSFEVVKRITAHTPQGNVDKLNELEFVKGEIWANIWYEDRIARISPADGEVLGWIDLGSLYPRNKRATTEDVLNGIAYDAKYDRLFVTGKNWPQLFEIKVVHK